MTEKKCATCKEVKNVSAFFKCASAKDGLATICKECEKAYRHARYAQNKIDQLNETQTEAVCTKCNKTLPIDKFIRTPALKGGRQHHCSDCESIRTAQYFSDPRKRNMRTINMIKKRCRDEDIPFDLTVDDIVIPDVCPMLGIPLSLNPAHRDNYPSVDRKVPSLGYIKGNINIISYRANRIKNDATIEELRCIVQFMEANS